MLLFIFFPTTLLRELTCVDLLVLTLDLEVCSF